MCAQKRIQILRCDQHLNGSIAAGAHDVALSVAVALATSDGPDPGCKIAALLAQRAHGLAEKVIFAG